MHHVVSRLDSGESFIQRVGFQDVAIDDFCGIADSRLHGLWATCHTAKRIASSLKQRNQSTTDVPGASGHENLRW